MVNIEKIKSLAKSKGISIAFICRQFGVGSGYLNDVAKKKNSMSEDRIRQIADMLGTTYEYLTDQSEDSDQQKVCSECVTNMVNVDKIRTLAKQQGIKYCYLCEQLGLKNTYLNDVARGKNSMGDDRIRQIADILDTTYEYLTDQTDDPEQPQDRQARRPGVRIPVYGEVAAGVPILAIENYDSDDPDDWEEIDEHMARGGDYIALRIHGASMEPRMRSGDIVIVRLQPDVESDEIAIVCVNGENATCKKIKKSPDGITLISLNPAFDPVFYSKREIAALPVTILGKVVELRAKF